MEKPLLQAEPFNPQTTPTNFREPQPIELFAHLEPSPLTTEEYLSFEVVCQYCNKTVITEVSQINGPLVWLWSACIFMTGLCFLVPLLLCWVPFCLASLKSCEHRCPLCAKIIARCVQ